jgi:hypothetical protein
LAIDDLCIDDREGAQRGQGDTQSLGEEKDPLAVEVISLAERLFFQARNLRLRGRSREVEA